MTVTGKTIGAGGSAGRAEATGYGLIYVLREALKERGVEPSATTASVQGFGLVGRHAIELYTQIGGKVRCVSALDSRTGQPCSVWRDDAIDVEELASISDRLVPQTDAIELEPLDSVISETTRMVYGNSSSVGITPRTPRLARRPWPISRRFGEPTMPVSPTQYGGKL